MADWPRLPDDVDPKDVDYEKMRYQGRVNAFVEHLKAQDAADAAMEKADWDAEYANDKAFQQSLLDATKGAIDRAKARAELIEKAALAVGTIYAGVLGTTFSITEKQMPIRGIVPSVFLAFAIAAAMVYLAYLTRPPGVDPLELHSSHVESQRRRINYFVTWVSATIFHRSYWLRSAVVSLAFGVAFLPLPFIHIPDDEPANELETQTAVSAAEKSPEPTATLVPWPSPQKFENASLTRILYQAEVNEVATQRQAALTTTSPAAINESDWIWAAVVTAAVLTFVIPGIYGVVDRKDGKGTVVPTLQPPGQPGSA